MMFAGHLARGWFVRMSHAKPHRTLVCFICTCVQKSYAVHVAYQHLVIARVRPNARNFNVIRIGGWGIMKLGVEGVHKPFL